MNTKPKSKLKTEEEIRAAITQCNDNESEICPIDQCMCCAEECTFKESLYWVLGERYY